MTPSHHWSTHTLVAGDLSIKTLVAMAMANKGAYLWDSTIHVVVEQGVRVCWFASVVS